RSLAFLTLPIRPSAGGEDLRTVNDLGLARSMHFDRRSGGALMMTCRCGGPLTLDLSHISEARRFSCLATTRLLWKCCLCGHSLWLDQATTPDDLSEPVEAEARSVSQLSA